MGAGVKNSLVFGVVFLALVQGYLFANEKDSNPIKNKNEFLSSEHIVVLISGASGSGKTFLADQILNQVGAENAVLLSEDFYYKDQSHLPMNIRETTNYDHPASLDHVLLVKDLMKLKKGESIEAPVYDYKVHNRSKDVKKLDSRSIIIVEGILLLSDPEVRKLADIKVFVDTPLDLSLTRRIGRDVSERGRTVHSVLAQYNKTVRPMFFEYILPSKNHADIILAGDLKEKNDALINLIKAKSKELASQSHASKVVRSHLK